jgi:copper chaperone CopZ
MKRFRSACAAALCGLVLTSGFALAETTVTLTGTHLCCPQCVKAVEKIMKGIDGAEAKIEQKAKKITITAKDDATAQKAVDALTDHGFYGKVDNAKVTTKKVADVPGGKVAKLTLTGIHNCCGQCTNAIKKTVTKINGVTGTNIANKETTFTVEGDFEAAAVVQALLDAGFTVKIKK